MSEIVQPLRFCGVLCNALHDQLASLGRHAQLTRCFSAVAELLVESSNVLLTQCIGQTKREHGRIRQLPKVLKYPLLSEERVKLRTSNFVCTFI